MKTISGTAAGMTMAAALVVAMSLLVGCGKKGPPDPPGPADQVRYPKVYPTH
jgi:predicted small lipoprotein YifL